MPPDHIASFLPAMCTGLGLFLAGAVNLLFLRRSFLVRAGATGAAVAIALAAAAAIDEPGVVAATSCYLLLALVVIALLQRRVLTGVSTLVEAAGRPVVRFGLLTAAGIAVALGSVVSFERTDEAIALSALDELELLHGTSPTTLVERSQATTDQGTKVSLKHPAELRNEQLLSAGEQSFLRNSKLDSQVIRTGTVDERVNCHGWVFTGGQYLLTGAEVDTIIRDNNYHEEATPAPGDLVVYRALGEVTHTAVVQYVTEGLPVLVKGKWGNLGIYIHPVDKSPYGSDFKYYRSSRAGHLLAGIPAVKTDAVVPAVAE